jgi:hypothetical protein
MKRKTTHIGDIALGFIIIAMLLYITLGGAE